MTSTDCAATGTSCTTLHFEHTPSHIRIFSTVFRSGTVIQGVQVFSDMYTVHVSFTTRHRRVHGDRNR
jgi:hypothetical protein